MRKTTVSVLMFSIMCSSATVWAADQIKPGLWEMTIKSDAMKNVPKIPPEQMKKMREMGITIPQMQDGGIVNKVCISKEMAERNDTPQFSQKESGCQSKNHQRSGNSYSMDIVCDGPDMKGTGKVRGTNSGGDRFTSTYDFKGTAHGQPVTHKQETSGKWLSADCGSVKPMDQAARKK
jgi:hypothetical protein